MISTYLVIHTGYKDTEIGIYSQNSSIASLKEDNKKLSKNFVNIIEKLLSTANINFSDLNFIATNQGPAPLTTLRVTLGFVNGLSFATNISLVGVNSLEVLLKENLPEKILEKNIINFAESSKPLILSKVEGHERGSLNILSVAILNAFSNQVYYAFLDSDTKKIISGYSSIESLLELLKTQKDQIKIFGNAVEMHMDLIKQELSDAIIEKDMQLATLNGIAFEALNNYKNNINISNQLLPIYLKESAQTKVC